MKYVVIGYKKKEIEAEVKKRKPSKKYIDGLFSLYSKFSIIAINEDTGKVESQEIHEVSRS